MNKLKRWFLTWVGFVDTSPEYFEKWFEGMIGRGLQGGQVFYAIAVKGRPGIPTIGPDWKLYASINDAEKKRKRLQKASPHLTLEIRIVRNFYSEVK